MRFLDTLLPSSSSAAVPTNAGTAESVANLLENPPTYPPPPPPPPRAAPPPSIRSNAPETRGHNHALSLVPPTHTHTHRHSSLARSIAHHPPCGSTRQAGGERRRSLRNHRAVSTAHRAGQQPILDPIDAFIKAPINPRDFIEARAGIVTVSRVPPKAAEDWKRCLLHVTRAAGDQQLPVRRQAAYSLLLLLPALLLSHSAKGGNRALQREVKRRCRIFMQGRLDQLIRERDEIAKAFASRGGGRRGGQTGAEADGTRRKLLATVARLADHGQLSKARAQLLSPGIAPTSPHVLQQLRDKHPARQVPIDWGHIPANPTEPIDIPWDDLEEVLRKAPRLSGPGPSGFRTDHLQSILHTDLPPSDKTVLSKFFTDIANARVPPNILDCLLSSYLVPIRKAVDSEDVRPVTLGETLLKIPARCIVKAFRPRLTEHFISGSQFGEGVPGGLESVVHSVRLLLDQNPNHIALSLDMKNAFNTIRRADVAQQLHASFPEIVPFFKMSYDPKSRLYVRTNDGGLETLISDEGTKQGDPIAGTLFNIGFLHVPIGIRQQFPTVTPFGIHDDITLVGPPAEVFQALAWAVPSVPVTTGCHLQPTKTLAFCPAGAPPPESLPPGIRWWQPPQPGDPAPALEPGITYVRSTSGLVVAGVPVGTRSDFVSSTLTSFNDETAKLDSAIASLSDAAGFSRQSFLLVFYCLRPRPNHLLRGLPSRYLTEFAQRHDNILRGAIAHILGLTALSQETERQVFSPQSSSAGFSFTESAVVAPIAYVASLALSAAVMVRVPVVRLAIDALTSPVPPVGADSRWWQDYQDARTQAELTCEEDVPTLEDLVLEPVRGYQRHLTSRMKANTVHRVLDGLTPYEWARVTSAGSRGASGWLTAIPSEDGGQPLSSEQFVMAMLWRLGLPQPILRGIRHCSMGDRHPVVDPHGVHFVNRNCGSANTARFNQESLTGEWRTIRHDAIAREVESCVREAGFRQKWQPGPLAGLPPDRKGDIEVYDFPCAGQSLIIDVTCVSPYSADQTLSHPPDGEPLRSARVAEAGKETSYRSLDRTRYGFLPLAFDVFGGVAPTADDFFQRLAAIAVRKRTTLTEGPAFSAKYSVLLNKWRTRLSVALHREVANAIIAGARNARGGERACPAEGSEGVIHLFEPVRPVVGF